MVEIANVDDLFNQREEKTGEMSNIDGEEIIEYPPRPKLKENCHKFLMYGTANIDDIDKMD